MQYSVSLSFASQNFSIDVNIGGKLQWTGCVVTADVWSLLWLWYYC